MSSRIEQIIDEIEEYIGSCKYQPLSTTKIIVNREELDDLLRELRLKTPDEVKRYQKIIANKDAILEDAQAKADAMVAQAKATTDEMLSEHEIIQQAIEQANEIVQSATEQANEILTSATEDANAIRTGAIEYTDEMLGTLQTIIGNTIDSAGAKYGNLLKTLQDCFDVVNTNRGELHPEGVPQPREQAPVHEETFETPRRSQRRRASQYEIDPELDRVD